MDVASAGTCKAVSIGLAAVLALVGCVETAEPSFGGGGDASETFDLEVEVSEEIPTVAAAYWDLVVDDVDDAYVEFGSDGEYGLQAPASVDGRDFHATLFGLHGDTEYTARAVVVTADGELLSRQADFVTGATPPSLPDIELTEESGDDAPAQGLMFTSIVDEYSTAVVIDSLGNLVWWHALQDKEGVITRSVLSRDGASVLYLFRDRRATMRTTTPVLLTALTVLFGYTEHVDTLGVY